MMNLYELNFELKTNLFCFGMGAAI